MRCDESEDLDRNNRWTLKWRGKMQLSTRDGVIYRVDGKDDKPENDRPLRSTIVQTVTASSPPQRPARSKPR